MIKAYLALVFLTAIFGCSRPEDSDTGSPAVIIPTDSVTPKIPADGQSYAVVQSESGLKFHTGLLKKDDKYKKVIGDAAKFLKGLQWDDGEGKKPEDDFFGGAGYDSKSRPDLSNTQFFLDALKAAGTPADDSAFKKAAVFVSRCQNLKSEHNQLPWAGKINDGSFIYSAADGGSTKTSDAPDAPLTGYGSMTYAGVKSLIYAGVGKDDKRVTEAVTWLRKNYTVEANAGMPPQLAGRGLFYYYHTMAKTMALLGEDDFADDKGIKHDWKTDLFRAIEKRQGKDGSWTNPTDRWMEGDPYLVSGYMLMALSYLQPK